MWYKLQLLHEGGGLSSSQFYFFQNNEGSTAPGSGQVTAGQ